MKRISKQTGYILWIALVCILVGALLFALGYKPLKPRPTAETPSAHQAPASPGLHVVVLGSSTAAGNGPSVKDSAWVNRLRLFLKQANPNNRVTNLARGGYVSYQLLPTAAPNRSWRWRTDTARNISKALSLQADLVIVNLPSNDNSFRIAIAQQLANLRRIVSEAKAAGIPIWVSTTQPVDKRRMLKPQLQVRDSIQKIFYPFVIDFWSELADRNGQIKPDYAKGDGIHLNAKGHDLLYQRVVQAIDFEKIYRVKQSSH